jgi:hypothetical protein
MNASLVKHTSPETINGKIRNVENLKDGAFQATSFFMNNVSVPLPWANTILCARARKTIEAK